MVHSGTLLCELEVGNRSQHDHGDDDGGGGDAYQSRLRDHHGGIAEGVAVHAVEGQQSHEYHRSY